MEYLHDPEYGILNTLRTSAVQARDFAKANPSRCNAGAVEQCEARITELDGRLAAMRVPRTKEDLTTARLLRESLNARLEYLAKHPERTTGAIVTMAKSRLAELDEAIHAGEVASADLSIRATAPSSDGSPVEAKAALLITGDLAFDTDGEF